MTCPLIDWLSDPRPGKGIQFAESSDAWEWYSYDQLSDLALRNAQTLIDDGARKDDVICIVYPTGPSLIGAIFGAWAAGATVCLIPPPTLLTDADEYIEYLSAVLQTAQPVQVICTEELVSLIRSAVLRAGLRQDPRTLRPAARRSAPRPQADFALLQFTSGSSGRPRGVQVSFANLAANIAMISQWLNWEPDDGVASWLPLYHDMGLIGCLLAPMTAQQTIWLMRPEQFLRDPLRWLACLGDGRARFTSAPTFGYAYSARRLRQDDLKDLDFSRWRTAIVGAERIDPAALCAFASLLAGHGFSESAFRPAYGLAEATLAVTGAGDSEEPAVVRPDWSGLSLGAPIRIHERARLSSIKSRPSPEWLVGCGAPLGDTQVFIADPDGQRLPDGSFGEIIVTGPSVTTGYRVGVPAGSTRFADGMLWTGDAGFLYDGQLFIVGRIGDSLKVRGKSVYVEELEATVAAAAGIPGGRCVAVSSSTGTGTTVVLLAELTPGAWLGPAVLALRQELGDEPPIQIVTGPRGLIRRGTSGKPRRRHIWEELNAGRLGGTVVHDERGSRSAPYEDNSMLSAPAQDGYAAGGNA